MHGWLPPLKITPGRMREKRRLSGRISLVISFQPYKKLKRVETVRGGYMGLHFMKFTQRGPLTKQEDAGESSSPGR